MLTLYEGAAAARLRGRLDLSNRFFEDCATAFPHGIPVCDPFGKLPPSSRDTDAQGGRSDPDAYHMEERWPAGGFS